MNNERLASYWADCLFRYAPTEYREALRKEIMNTEFVIINSRVYPVVKKDKDEKND